MAAFLLKSYCGALSGRLVRPTFETDRRETNMIRTYKLSVGIWTIGVLLAGSSQVVTANNIVTVVNNGTSPGVTVGVNLPWLPYNGGALAGVENLVVNGQP